MHICFTQLNLYRFKLNKRNFKTLNILSMLKVLKCAVSLCETSILKSNQILLACGINTVAEWLWPWNDFRVSHVKSNSWECSMTSSSTEEICSGLSTPRPLQCPCQWVPSNWTSKKNYVRLLWSKWGSQKWSKIKIIFLVALSQNIFWVQKALKMSTSNSDILKTML